MRKEIIVAGEVFDLGLKGLEEATESCRVVGQEMELEVAGRIFQVGVSTQDKALPAKHRLDALRGRRPLVATRQGSQLLYLLLRRKEG